MPQRHGSGDPTPCGGYPGPDCWLLFFIELVRKRLYERHCVHKGINGAYAISGNNAGGVIFDPYWAEPVVILIARD